MKINKDYKFRQLELRCLSAALELEELEIAQRSMNERYAALSHKHTAAVLRKQMYEAEEKAKHELMRYKDGNV